MTTQEMREQEERIPAVIVELERMERETMRAIQRLEAISRLGGAASLDHRVSMGSHEQTLKEIRGTQSAWGSLKLGADARSTAAWINAERQLGWAVMAYHAFVTESTPQERATDEARSALDVALERLRAFPSPEALSAVEQGVETLYDSVRAEAARRGKDITDGER